ncbi:hypothetical protein Vadar_014985 [Vaccinium darrowii]|uniref:Uncharacterized protein n=1 Tax=Vaccinium darrowii TaxID=229202 RepID=A0ACB7ZJN8_9ERIC|nr:hypothetical protein Vadar_014985 [Vaccinium darrowii]
MESSATRISLNTSVIVLFSEMSHRLITITRIYYIDTLTVLTVFDRFLSPDLAFESERWRRFCFTGRFMSRSTRLISFMAEEGITSSKSLCKTLRRLLVLAKGLPKSMQLLIWKRLGLDGPE